MEKTTYGGLKVRKGDIVAILHFMEQGATSVGAISESTDYSRQRVHFVLNHLIKIGVVKKYDWGRYVINNFSSHRGFFSRIKKW